MIIEPSYPKSNQSGAANFGLISPPFDLHFSGKADYTVIPVFSDYTDDEWRRFTNGMKKNQFFKGKVAEVLPTENSLLLGLGDRSKFHPDNIASAYRLIGAKLANIRPESVAIQIPETLVSVVKNHTALFENNFDPYVMPSSEIKKSHSKKTTKSNESKSSYSPDYLQPFSESDLVFQIVYSIYLGGSSTAILKSKKNDDATDSVQKLSKTKKQSSIRLVLTSTALNSTLIEPVAKEAAMVGELAASSRNIAALPSNYLNPEQYERFARNFAKQYGLKISVIKGTELEKQGFGGVISVGQGSEIPPRVLIVEYQSSNKSADPLVLVGKGITFDTGGISLKPPAEMHEMKYDMCGSALALHGVAVAAQKKVSFSVIGLLGIAENMPDGKAINPGDVYTAYNGVTVEVQNTDAEGRLVLGDLLGYACKKYPHARAIFDFATLTGACVIALGHEATGYMTGSEKLSAQIDLACRRSLERGWRLPHWSVYDAGLKSDIADVRNVAGRAAGTVTAMRFLSNFVEPNIAWAHFDIAGSAWLSVGAEHVKGPTAWGLRFLKQFFDQLDGRDQ